MGLCFRFCLGSFLQFDEQTNSSALPPGSLLEQYIKFQIPPLGEGEGEGVVRGLDGGGEDLEAAPGVPGGLA